MLSQHSGTPPTRQAHKRASPQHRAPTWCWHSPSGRSLPHSTLTHRDRSREKDAHRVGWPTGLLPTAGPKSAKGSRWPHRCLAEKAECRPWPGWALQITGPRDLPGAALGARQGLPEPLSHRPSDPSGEPLSSGLQSCLHRALPPAASTPFSHSPTTATSVSPGPALLGLPGRPSCTLPQQCTRVCRKSPRDGSGVFPARGGGVAGSTCRWPEPAPSEGAGEAAPRLGLRSSLAKGTP